MARAIVDVDNMWRKDTASEPRSSEESERKPSVDNHSGQPDGSLKSLLSNVRQGIDAMNVEFLDHHDNRGLGQEWDKDRWCP